MNWTQEQRDELIRLWDGGKRSYSEIARILGLNKNQIVGRMRREKRIRGIPVLDQYAHFRTTKPRKKKVKKMKTLPTRAEFAMSKRVVPVVVPDHGQLSSIVDVTGCRWPVSFDDAVPGGHLFCNHATDGQTYCPYHSQESVAHYSRALIRKTTRDAIFAYTRKVA